jgi:type 1 glutamine amidotransferase
MVVVRHDQSSVPLEVEPTDPGAKKVVLVAGHLSHGSMEHEFFAGTAILMDMLKQEPGVFPVMARDGWPKNPALFKGARSVVFYMDGGEYHPLLQEGRMDLFQKYIDEGVGFVNLHYAVEYPAGAEAGDRILSWLGGYYEPGWSINPHWEAEIKSLPRHAVTRGAEPFKIEDEWYYNMRFVPEMKGVTPILKATPPDETRETDGAKAHPGREEVVAWTYERSNGGRSFGFTGGHMHANWGDTNFRRLVVNAILWTAHVEVPAEGAKVQFNPDDLNRNLDKKE